MHGDPGASDAEAHGTKRKYSEIEHEDDKESPNATEMEMKTETETASQESQKAAARSIRLKFTTPNNKELVWPVTEEVIAQIPCYEAEVAAIRSSTPKCKVICITDDVKRDEQRMFDLVVYLSTGIIRGIPKNWSGPPLHGIVERLLDLCKLARSFQLLDLEQKIHAKITAEERLPATEFVEMASRCCADESGMDVSKGSHTRQWIEDYVDSNVRVLREGGHVDDIVGRGGALLGIMVDKLADMATGVSGR